MLLGRKLLTGDKGRLGEAKAIASLVEQGYEVFIPVGGNTTCDLVAIKNKVALRVEVKYVGGSKPYNVQLRQTRHNMGTVTVKHFDSDACDLLVVYIAELDKTVLVEDVKSLHGRAGLRVK